MFLSRYFIVSLPGLVLLAGVGIALIEDKYCYTILLILLTLLSVRSTITQYYPKEKEENNRDSASFVLSHAQRGDGILFYRAGAIVCFEYYWKRLNPPADLIDSVYPTKFGQYKYKDHDLTVSYLESLKDRNERIWVVLRQNGDEFRFIPNTLKKNYQLQQEKNYTGIHVLLFVKKKVS